MIGLMLYNVNVSYLADIDVSEQDDSNRQESVDTRDEVIVNAAKQY